MRASNKAVASAADEAALKAKILASLATKPEASPSVGLAPQMEDLAAAPPDHVGDHLLPHPGDGNLPLPVADRGKTPREAGDLAPAGLQAPSTEEESEA